MPSVAYGGRSPGIGSPPLPLDLSTQDESPSTLDAADQGPTPPSPPPTLSMKAKGKRKGSQSEKSGSDKVLAEGEAGATPRDKKKIKVGARASIACTTCRKRKVRCSGEWPTCAFCTGRKMKCTYEGQHPAETTGTSTTSRLPGPSGWFNHEAVQTPTEATLPDSKLVVEAIDTFLTHYHDTFPFLHRRSLIDSVLNGTASRELICSILALASRFCQPLRELHPSSISAAAEYYAVLASQLLSLPDAKPLFPTHTAAAQPSPLPDSEVSLTRCQCYLLLSLYELTAGRDHSGWLKLGQAIRMAQILRLGFDDEVDYSSASLGEDPRGRGRSASSTSVSGSRDSSSSRNSHASTSKLPDPKVPAPRPPSIDPLVAETRRRTFWSCFLLDRTISDGNERPCGLKVPKIASLRMPGSDADFANGRKGIGARFDPDPPPWSVSVRTAQQKKEEEEEASRNSAEEELVGRLIRSRTTTVNSVEPEADLYGYTLRIADIWRSVASYIGAGGRNVDRRPPWQEDSTFYALAQQLNEFGDRLPQELRYTDQTLIAHCMTSTMDARLFGMLHLLFAAASHVLHRDYLPFLPPADFKASGGPVDGEPLYGDSTSPPGWWQRSFDVAVHSAKIISDVCTHLASHGIVLAHPFAGYAALAAGTVHCHLKYWPQEAHSAETATKYFQQDCAFLNSLRNVYPIAARWCEAMSGLQLLYYNLARGILDADPVRVRAGVIQLLRSAKEDQLASSTTSQSTAVDRNTTPSGSASATAKGKDIDLQPPPLPPFPTLQRHDHPVASTITSPALLSASLSLTPSLLPVPGTDLPTDFSFDLNAISVPGFGYGFDDLGYWGSSGNGGGWLNGGFSGLGSAVGGHSGMNGSSLFGSDAWAL
ncbi:Zn(II)2Cys6 transcription factor [Sporobolomyces salmoneus]|uniref:Zn(II)2Cys6 transcription factor n=1 Tax=Sporobolomyces salmoneus TaxID=183962 RepID=UPI00317CC0B5